MRLHWCSNGKAVPGRALHSKGKARQCLAKAGPGTASLRCAMPRNGWAGRCFALRSSAKARCSHAVQGHAGQWHGHVSLRDGPAVPSNATALLRRASLCSAQQWQGIALHRNAWQRLGPAMCRVATARQSMAWTGKAMAWRRSAWRCEGIAEPRLAKPRHGAAERCKGNGFAWRDRATLGNGKAQPCCPGPRWAMAPPSVAKHSKGEADKVPF